MCKDCEKAGRPFTHFVVPPWRRADPLNPSGRWPPSSIPVIREPERQSGGGESGEQVAGASILQVEFGKHRANLLRPQDDRDV
jgi:hypothetical protein